LALKAAAGAFFTVLRGRWCCYTLDGWCLINADGKGYRVGVFAGILNIVTGKFKGKLCTA
jgi:hypothetical protein